MCIASAIDQQIAVYTAVVIPRTSFPITRRIPFVIGRSQSYAVYWNGA